MTAAPSPARAVVVGRSSQLPPVREAVRRLGLTVAAEVVVPEPADLSRESASLVQGRILSEFREGRADALACRSLDDLAAGGPQRALEFLHVVAQDPGARCFISVEQPLLDFVGPPEQRERVVGFLAWSARSRSRAQSDGLRAAAAKRRDSTLTGDRPRWGRGLALTPGDVERIRALRAEGRTYAQIQVEMGFSLGTVSNVLGWRRDRSVPS